MTKHLLHARHGIKCFMYVSEYDFYRSHYISFFFYSWKLRSSYPNIGENLGSKNLSTLPKFPVLAVIQSEFRPTGAVPKAQLLASTICFPRILPGPWWSKKQNVWMHLLLGQSPLVSFSEWAPAGAIPSMTSNHPTDGAFTQAGHPALVFFKSSPSPGLPMPFLLLVPWTLWAWLSHSK